MEPYVGYAQIDTDFDEDGNPTGGVIIPTEHAGGFILGPGQEDLRKRIANALARLDELRGQQIEDCRGGDSVKDQPTIMAGVREYAEDMDVELMRTDDGRLAIQAYNECGFNITQVDLLDVLQWAEQHKELIKEL